MTRSTRFLFLTSLALVLAAAAAHGGPVRVVAASGGQAAGLPAGATYSFLSDAVINASGDVCFFATFLGGGVSAADNQAIYVGGPGDLDVIARRGSRAPGTGGADYAALTFDLALRDSGRVLFRGSISAQAEESDGGLWVGDPGDLALVLQEGDTAPGTTVTVSGDTLFPNAAARGPCVNDSGVTAFRVFLTGDATSADDEALLYGAAGDVQLLAREGDVAPEVAGAVFVDFSPRLAFPSLCLGDDGTAVFIGRVGGEGVDFRNRDGLWAGTPGDVSLVARGGDPAEVFAAGRVFRAFTNGATANGAGAIFFDALTVDAGGSQPMNGLFLDDGGLQIVARQGDPAPSDPDQLEFGSGFGDLRLNAAGRVAFLARMVDGDAVLRESIYTGTPGSLTLIARDNAPAPGLDGVTFVNPNSPFLGADGSIVFLANLAGTGVVLGTNDQSVWIAEPDGTVSLLARSGDALGVLGESKVMSSFSFYDGENAGDSGGGGGSPIGASGEVVLTVAFSDFTRAIVVTTETFGFPPGDPPDPDDPNPLCTDLDDCLARLAAALPDPSQAPDRRARKAAKKLARFNKKLGKAALELATATKDRKRRKFAKKLGKFARKVDAKAQTFQAKGRLNASQPLISGLANALIGFIPTN